jgi:AraC family transcriptional activator of tynA and feaB
VDCASGPVSGRRGRRQIAASPAEYVGALFVLDGGEVLQFGRSEIILTAGAAVIWDSTVPGRFTVPSYIRKRTLFIPRERLSDLGRDAAHVAGAVLPDGPGTRLLRDFLDSALETVGDEPSRAASAAVTATLELLAGAVDAQQAIPDDDRERRWLTVRDLIEERLADPALVPTSIARATGMSLRSLYELFAAREETVAGYVRRRRLVRARAELERARGGVTVAAVGQRWGFADQGTFTRAFRAHYGVTPGSVRR